MLEPSTRVLVIVPAAGLGTRFGGEIPKQFRHLAGRPILLHVIERLLLDERVTQVVVPVAEALLSGVKQTERVRFVAGGETRQESVMNGLEAMGHEFELVAVHDAVRPFFTIETFHLALDAASESGAALPVVPLTDTIHTVNGTAIAATLDRSALVAAQTPQCFRMEVLRDVLQRAQVEGMQGTDEAGLAARYGYTVRTVPGDPMNFKITRPEDFIVAEALVAKAAEAPA